MKIAIASWVTCLSLILAFLKQCCKQQEVIRVCECTTCSLACVAYGSPGSVDADIQKLWWVSYVGAYSVSNTTSDHVQGVKSHWFWWCCHCDSVITGLFDESFGGLEVCFTWWTLLSSAKRTWVNKPFDTWWQIICQKAKNLAWTSEKLMSVLKMTTIIK